MQTWFECKIKYAKVDDEGRERKVSEVYLVDAVSVTEAEARLIAQLETMIRGEFVIDKVVTSNIVEIFPHETGEWWYKAKIGIVTIDEEKGKEKKINNYFLVAADDIKQALQRLEEGLSYILVPYQTTALTLSPIIDVFPYFEDEATKAIPASLKPIVKAEPDSIIEEVPDEEEQWVPIPEKEAEGFQTC
jgi:hypothetical protein